jgi:hypothetical protein
MSDDPFAWADERDEARGRPMYYDRQGRPMPMRQWIMAIEGEPESRRVAYTRFDSGVWVSTVWLGINYNWGDGPPLIFETMVFCPIEPREVLGHWIDAEGDECWRWPTEEAALAGHDRIVAELTVPDRP